MSIASEITRLQGCKSDIRTALVNKGVTSASTHNMADFATDISNISAGGATITVTYDSSFYNKTMTCSNGTKTYTKTTTSSGSTTFSVAESGTWTITCNGVSRTVDVVLEYTTQMAITQTVTVYGAASDTISFTDMTGSKTVTTNSSGQGSVSITFLPPSQTITFTSSVAKNPSNLSQNYSKNVSLTTSTTSVRVMPDKVLYWYGYVDSNLENMSTTAGWDNAGAYQYDTPTYNTRDLTINASTDTKLCGVGTKNTVSMTKEYCITQVINTTSGGVTIMASKASPVVKNPFAASNDYSTITSTSMITTSLVATKSPTYACVRCVNKSQITLYAWWYE